MAVPSTLPGYAIAIGSNRRGRHGAPRAEVMAAIDAVRAIAIVRATAPILTTAAVGPSQRRFANGAVLIDSDLPPPVLLARLKAIERGFGRRRGQRWGSRVIDLDIILWSGGRWSGPALAIPHPAFRQRPFVLAPLLAIAGGWRDPVTRLTIRQLHYRARRG